MRVASGAEGTANAAAGSRITASRSAGGARNVTPGVRSSLPSIARNAAFGSPSWRCASRSVRSTRPPAGIAHTARLLSSGTIPNRR